MQDRHFFLHHKARFAWAIPVIALVALFVIVVMTLWNLLLPDIFGVSSIGFWQAAGLLLLSRLMFGGLGYGFGGWGHRSNRMREAWHKMDPEQRERLREKFRSHYEHKAEHLRRFFHHHPFEREDEREDGYRADEYPGYERDENRDSHRPPYRGKPGRPEDSNETGKTDEQTSDAADTPDSSAGKNKSDPSGA